MSFENNDNVGQSGKGFIEICESDTPYYQYLKNLKNEKNEFKGTLEPKFDLEEASLGLHQELEQMKMKDSITLKIPSKSEHPDQPDCISSSLLPKSSPTAKKSKNSIFEMDFSITKPIIQMTEKELMEYKASLGIPCQVATPEYNKTSEMVDSAIETPTASDKGEEKISVPVSLKYIQPFIPYHQIQETTGENQDVSRPSFLRHESSMRFFDRAFLQPQNEEEKETKVDGVKEPSLPSISSLLKKDAPFQHHPIFLSYLPLSKNKLGEGQFSSVYRGTYNSSNPSVTQIPCAVKASHKGIDSYANFLQEIVLLHYVGILSTCSLNGSSNPHVIGLIDVKSEQDLCNGKLYEQIIQKFIEAGGSKNWPPSEITENPIPRILLVLEYCAHGDMDTWLHKNPKVLGSKLFLKWAHQIASGLSALHSIGIIHHDIKPHNIMLNSVYDLKIADFGSAKFVPLIDDYFDSENQNATACSLNSSNQEHSSYFKFPLIVPERSGNVSRNPKHCLPKSIGFGRGTMAYNAPELLTSTLSAETSTYSFPIDMYAYGSLLYTIISGIPPFSSIRSTTQLIIIKTKHGFFAPEAQPLVTKWRNPDPTDWQWQFPDSSSCTSQICSLVRALVEMKPVNRPSALEVCYFFNRLSE